MNYKRLSNDELKKLKYPNLTAELIESHCSICTVREYMGLGRRKEDDPIVWGKLSGTIDILASEAVGLAGLFGVSLEYLFSNELKVIEGETAAVIRWKDFNRELEKEREVRNTIDEISRELRENSELLQFVKNVVQLSVDERKELLQFMQKEFAPKPRTVRGVTA